MRMRDWLLLGAAVAIVIAGFCGLDWVVYEALRPLNTGGPADGDFYERTKWLWELIRWPVTMVGAAALYFVVVVINRRGWVVATAGLLSVCGAGATTFIAQRVIGRVRPNHALKRLDDYKDLTAQLWARPELTFITPPVCFPSGESTGAFALATMLSIAAPRWSALFYLYAMAVAVARLVQGAHYLGDVTAGAVVGIMVTRVLYRAIEPHVARRLEQPAL